MNVQESATRLLHDYDAGCPSKLFEKDGGAWSVSNAYDIQFAVAEMRESRGERVAGYKVGCISETMQTQLGIEHPVFGHLWESEFHSSGSTLPWDRFDNLAIEGEYGYRILDDIPSAAWLRENPDVLGPPQLVIELHNYVFRGPQSIRAVELIANNAIHAGVVLDESACDLAGSSALPELVVHRNSECLGKGKAEHLRDGPLAIIAKLMEHLEQRGHGIKREQLVLSGSPLPLWKLAPGDEMIVTCEGMAEVRCVVEK